VTLALLSAVFLTPVNLARAVNLTATAWDSQGSSVHSEMVLQRSADMSSDVPETSVCGMTKTVHALPLFFKPQKH
jgi:hypothetical protein